MTLTATAGDTDVGVGGVAEVAHREAARALGDRGPGDGRLAADERRGADRLHAVVEPDLPGGPGVPGADVTVTGDGQRPADLGRLGDGQVVVVVMPGTTTVVDAVLGR